MKEPKRGKMPCPMTLFMGNSSMRPVHGITRDRVVFKIEKPFGQMIHLYTFVVTNMDSSPEELIRFYCKRGQMENFIKESKIAARIVRKARYVVFKLCSSCPFQHKFYETFYNIRQIQPLTES